MEQVSIRRQYNDYRVAKVPFPGLSDIHWSRVSGGVNSVAPQPFLHAYVWCNQIEGEIAHSCQHGPGPHHIKVVILKKDNPPEVYEKVLEKAGPLLGWKRAMPYFHESDVDDIYNALITGSKHPAIEIKGHKEHGEILVIKPKNIKRLTADGTANTIRARAKRVRLAVQARMRDRKGFSEVQYWYFLSYKKDRLIAL